MSCHRLADDEIHLSQSTRPRWAVALAVLTFPVGLLSLGARVVRTCSIRVVPAPTGSVLVLSGDVTPDMEADVRAALMVRSAPPDAIAPRATDPVDPPAATAVATVGSGFATGPTHPLGSMLIVVAGTGARLRVHAGERYVLGRDPRLPGATSVLVPDPRRRVSKTHAAVGLDPQGAYVEDLRSTNGTVLVLGDGTSREVRPGPRVALTPDSSIWLAGVEVRIEAG